MRPLRLEVEGFTSFRDRTVVDFDGLQLFAITGPTGAGKSSLIDAMLLALFGKVPRVADKYGQLITDGADQVVVRFDFEVDGARYRVARRLRHKGAPQVALERAEGQGFTSVAGGSKEVTAQVERILGIDYDAFTRAVVLPQGQFDEFLRGDAQKRRKVLVDLLDLEVYRRMADLARERAQTRAGGVAESERRLQSEFAEATPEKLEALRRQLADADAAAIRLDARIAAVEGAVAHALRMRQLRENHVRVQRADAEAERQIEAANEAMATQTAAAQRFAGQRSEIEQALAALPDATERSATIERAMTVARDLRRRQDAQQRADRDRDDATVALETASRLLKQLDEVEVPKAKADVEAATAAEQRAREADDEAKRRHAARHLRAELRAGEACPVCEQPIATVPAAGAPPPTDTKLALAQASKALDRAKEQLVARRRDHDHGKQQLPKLRKFAADAAQHCATLAADAAALVAELAATGLDLPEPFDLGAFERTLQTQRRLLDEQRGLRTDLQQRLQALLDAERERDATMARLRGTVETLRGVRDGHAHELKKIARELTDATVALGESLREAGDPPPPVPDRPGAPDEATTLQALLVRLRDEQNAASTARGALRQRCERVAADVETARRLRADLELARGDAAVHADLARLLAANRFQDFVQQEAIALLTEDGSARLRQLSQGRYSLRHDGSEFVVVDHWSADRERSVRTLSGGETFLASLALSLGLAERIAALAAGRTRGAAVLECLFIDEGFGALDPEALEAAVQALETLHGGRRMVGVVTHLAELAERLPARIRVDNTGGRAHASVT